jgi:putative DNA primase/helicase
MPDLSTREGQDALKPFLEGVELLVLDNLSSLVRCGGESESDTWIPIQEWLLKLRRRGIAVLLVHHAGKSGSQAHRFQSLVPI